MHLFLLPAAWIPFYPSGLTDHEKVKAIDVKSAPSVEDEGGNDGKVRSSVSSSPNVEPTFYKHGYSRNGKNIAVACGDSSIIVYSVCL